MAKMNAMGEDFKTLVSNESPVSVVCQSDLNEKGFVTVIGEEVAGLVKGDVAHELMKETRHGATVYSLQNEPASEHSKLAMQIAERKVRKVARKRKLQERLSHRKRGHHPRAPPGECTVCDSANLETSPSHRSDDNKIPEGTDTGYVVVYDILGPVEPDIEGNIYAFVALECEGGRGHVTLSKTKSGLHEAWKQARMEILAGNKAGERPLAWRRIYKAHSDKERAFLAEFDRQLKEAGVLVTHTGGYNSNANARAEQRIKKLSYFVRAMLMEATGGGDGYKDLWGKAIQHANYLVSDLPERGSNTPNEKTGQGQADIDRDCHVFGAHVDILIPKKKRGKGKKFHPTSKIGIWIGKSRMVPNGDIIWWDQKEKSWKFDDAETTTSCRVNNEVFPLTKVPSKDGDAKNFDEFVDQFSVHAQENELYVVEKIVDSKMKAGKKYYLVKWQHYRSSENQWVPRSHLSEYGGLEMLQEYEEKTKKKAMVAALSTETERERAARHLIMKHKLTWTEEETQAAYEKEQNKMMKALVEVPMGSAEYNRVMRKRNYVRSRMNPEVKKDGRKNLRWIVMGNTEPGWMNPDGTDAPVAHTASIKMVVYAPEPKEKEKDITVMVADYEGAFTQTDDYEPHEDPRYMLCQAYKGSVTKMYRQKRPQYGNKNAARRWNKTVGPHLESMGYVAGKNDPCVYNNKIKVLEELGFKERTADWQPLDKTLRVWENLETKLVVFIRGALHVDDLIAKGEREKLQELEAQLRARFKMRTVQYLSEDEPITHLSHCIKMGYDEDGNKWYSMDQTGDITDFCEKNNIAAAKHVSRPMPNKRSLHIKSPKLNSQRATKYRSNLMWAMYIAKHTRWPWDILHPLSRLAALMQDPTESAERDLRQVLVYLATNNTEGYIKANVRRQDELEIYSDSDHAGDRGSDTISRSAGIIFYNGVPVDWYSKKQNATSLSSAEAETKATSEAAQRGMAMAYRAEELGATISWPLQIQVDNQARISFQKSTCPNTKLLGCFDLREKWVQELRDRNKVMTVKVHTKDNCSDLLTKCHPEGRFKELVQLIISKGRYN